MFSGNRLTMYKGEIKVGGEDGLFILFFVFCPV